SRASDLLLAHPRGGGQPAGGGSEPGAADPSTENCLMKRAQLLGVTCLALLTLGVLVGTKGCSRPEDPSGGKGDHQGRNQKPSYYLQKALDRMRTVASSPKSGPSSLYASRAVVAELNNYLKAQKPALRLQPGARNLLQSQLFLDAGELAEVESKVFTPLDAYYLQFCFQMAEAARSLDLRGLSTLERARLGFEWVVRQVSLKDRVLNNLGAKVREDDLLPPQMVLQLGYGMSKERALVFLALLQQMQIDGCMIALPGEDKGDK